MIIDDRTEFCDNVLLNTGAAGTYLLGDQVDLGTAAGNIGTQDNVYLVIQVGVGINAASAGTVSFQLASDDTAAIATNGTASVHFQTRAFVTGTGTATTTLRPGTVLAAVKLPQGFDYERFLGVLQVTGTAAITAGRIDAFLTSEAPGWRAYDSPSQA
jgi:hypothetical protein